MREIVGKMNLEEMVSDRQKFATLVKENSEPDLAAMGLDIVSFNVQNFVDENGVIENLGVDNIVKIQKNAAISRAESEKEIARAQAIAKKEANDAQVSSELEIANAIAKAQKEKAVVKAEADRESKEAQINAEPLAKVDKITMYGEGNSAKLMKDIMGTLNQVTDGLKESTGIDLQAVLAGFAGAKIAENSDKNDNE